MRYKSLVIEHPSYPYPPDTGQITATSSPPFRTITSGSSIISKSTLHRLEFNTFPRSDFEWREVRTLPSSESFKPSFGMDIFSEANPVVVEAAEKYSTVIVGCEFDMVTVKDKRSDFASDNRTNYFRLLWRTSTLNSLLANV